MNASSGRHDMLASESLGSERGASKARLRPPCREEKRALHSYGMKCFDGIIERCLDNNINTETHNDNTRAVHTAIALSENETLQAYNSDYLTERRLVNDVLNSVVTAQKDDEQLTAPDRINSVRFVDIKNNVNAFNEIHNKQIFVTSNLEECNLHETNSRKTLEGGGSIGHYYYIQDDNQAKLKSLTVTIVYSGCFVGAKYIPGVISVELKRVPKYRDPVSIGYKLEEFQRANTENEIGCTVIQYEIENQIIPGGLFEVEVSSTGEAHHDLQYSITLGACLACPLKEEVERDLARSMFTRKWIKETTEQIAGLDKNLILLEKKKQVEEELMNRAKNQREKCQTELERLDLELDWQDGMEDKGASIVEQIQNLKREHDESNSLFSLRSKLHESLTSKLKEMTEERALLNQRVQESEQEVKDSIASISMIASHLWGVQASNAIVSTLFGSEDARKSDDVLPTSRAPC